MNAKELLKEKQEKLVGETLEFPLVKVKIDQEQGRFRIGGTKNEEGEWEGADYVSELSFVLFKRYSEYFYFNPETEKVEKRSTIEENPSQAKELISGIPISELKEAGYQFTFVAHLVGLEVNSFTPIDLMLKGSGVKAFIEFLEKEKSYWKNRLLNKLVIKLEKKKKGAVVYWVPVFEITEVSDNEAKMVLEKIDVVLDEFEQFIKLYNSRYQKKEKENEKEKEKENTTDEIFEYEDGILL